MAPTSVPELQQKLFKQMGLSVPEQAQPRKSTQGRGPSRNISRKDQRKAQRVQKRTNRYVRLPAPQHTDTTPGTKSTKNIPHKASASSTRTTSSTSRGLSESDDGTQDSDLASDIDEDDQWGQEESKEGSDDDKPVKGRGNKHSEAQVLGTDEMRLSRADREKLAKDDAEIKEFERKLGIKKGRKSLPQSFKDDGLDDLLDPLAADDSSSEGETKKRKLDYDDWLSSKRRKMGLKASDGSAKKLTNAPDEDSVSDDSGEELDEDDFDELDGHDSDESFSGFDSEPDQAALPQPRQRENPYIAPTTGTVVAKYVPPSLRKAAASEGEEKSRLRKQIQGLINRLTDANILSIVQSIDELYQHNARGDVTEILTDAILAQVCKPETLPDQFFVLTGGFSAALYKITGSSFGSHLVRRVVKDFATEFEQALGNNAGARKETSNLISFLTQLYVFEVVSCKIIFDYMERLLNDLTELNVELLLRICRMAGRLLRRDDPQTLKHVAGVLNASVSKIGYANASARSKFMIETINDLKNSKPKGRGMDSAIVSEHVMRMKKHLGDLKSQSRRLDGLAPMGMGVDDIEGADTQGKWWLVGASVPVKPEASRRDNTTQSLAKASGNKGDDSTDDEDMDMVLPDYPSKARAQGLNTTSQIAIFTALMSAMNYEHGYRQFINLKLKKDEQLEVARVLVQCVGSELQYNEYYALVAVQACSNSRVRFALQDRLWKIFRGLGESLFGEDADDDDTADSERMRDSRRMSYVSRFYASLVAEGALGITILKPLDLPEMNAATSAFVEWIMISLLQECKKKGQDEDLKLEKVFGAARELPALAAGVHWVLRKRVRKTTLIGAKDVKRLVRVREKAQAIVQAVTQD